MFGLPPDQIIPFANFIGYGILGLIAALGLLWGKRKPADDASKTAEVVGAIVDGASVRMVAAAIEALNLEHRQNRHSQDKSRKIAYELAETLKAFTKEMEELRKELRALGDSVRKH